MSRIPAIFANGVFHPLEPVSCHEQERVVLTVENAPASEDTPVDNEFLAYVETQADDSVSLEEVRKALAKIPARSPAKFERIETDGNVRPLP